MSTMKFQYFSCLPWELRRMIWEAAIRPGSFTSNMTGMQSLSIVINHRMEAKRDSSGEALTYSDDEFDTYHVVAAPESDDNERPNRSAYMWDAGLWTACRESRDAISSRPVYRGPWREARRQFATRYAPIFYTGTPQLVPKPPTRIAPVPSLQNGSENWNTLMFPWHDAVKLSMEPMLEWMRAEPVRPRWDDLLANLPYLRAGLFSSLSCIPMLHIEYDSSWNDNWPNSITQLANELSPRGFVASFLRKCASREADGGICLIDRGRYNGLNWYYDEEVWSGPHVYYDCDDKYVQTYWEYRADDYHSSAHFIEKLGDLGSDEFNKLYSDSEWEDPEAGSSFYPSFYVGILRPIGSAGVQ